MTRLEITRNKIPHYEFILLVNKIHETRERHRVVIDVHVCKYVFVLFIISFLYFTQIDETAQGSLLINRPID